MKIPSQRFESIEIFHGCRHLTTKINAPIWRTGEGSLKNYIIRKTVTQKQNQQRVALRQERMENVDDLFFLQRVIIGDYAGIYVDLPLIWESTMFPIRIK